MATASWGHVGDMIGCDHPSCVPVGRLVGELWHFEYISNMAAVRHLKKLTFDLVTVIAVLSCCCIPNFIKIGSRVRPPDVHNCRMFNAKQQQLPWQPHHGGHVGHMMGCDHPICVPVGPLVGELWHFEYFSNMAAVRHFEFL